MSTCPSLRSKIAQRRAALSETLTAAQQEYERLESQLRELDRQLCAMHGGIQELAALNADSFCDHPCAEFLQASAYGESALCRCVRNMPAWIERDTDDDRPPHVNPP